MDGLFIALNKTYYNTILPNRAIRLYEECKKQKKHIFTNFVMQALKVKTQFFIYCI